MMETTNAVTITNSIELIKQGPEILTVNQTRAQKAIQVGNNIIAAINQSGMTAELDVRANNYLANCATALKEMKEGRAAVTQIMDELKKLFTSVENDMDVKKEGTVASQIQAHRNSYAKKLAEEKEAARREAELIAAKQKEKAELEYAAATRLSEYYNNYLLETKQQMQKAFDAVTLDNYYEKLYGLNNYTPYYSPEHLQKFDAKLYSTLHTPDELKQISIDATSGKYNSFSVQFVQELAALRRELIDKMPSKLSELEQQKKIAEQIAAEADAQKAAALKAQQDEAIRKQQEREQQEQAKLIAEAEEAKKKAALEAEIAKQAQTTMSLFEQEAATAAVADAPESRQGYNIVILHPVAYVQIFQLWFEKQGKELPVDKLGNTKLDQMKAWAEKHAHKTGEKIESKYLQYENEFKAVNRK